MATVLVIDDEFGIAEVIEMALEDEGHRVVAAGNGEQGLERLAEAAVDLVLLDYMMPLLDGPGVLRAGRAAGHAGGPEAARHPRGADDLFGRGDGAARLRRLRGVPAQAVPDRPARRDRGRGARGRRRRRGTSLAPAGA